MKTFRITLSLFVFALFTPFANISASTEVSAKEARETMVKKIATGKAQGLADAMKDTRMVKKLTKIQKRFFGKGQKVDFQDPVEKWKWFWIFGWAAGLVLYSIGWVGVSPLWYLGYLCWVAGTVCLIIWLLKKTGNM